MTVSAGGSLSGFGGPPFHSTPFALWQRLHSIVTLPAALRGRDRTPLARLEVMVQPNSAPRISHGAESTAIGNNGARARGARP